MMRYPYRFDWCHANPGDDLRDAHTMAAIVMRRTHLAHLARRKLRHALASLATVRP